MSEQARKALSDPVAVCDALGLSRGAKRQPHGLVVCCPWHGDRHPSCSVRSVDGDVVAHCFACGARGDVFALVAQVRGLDVRRDFSRVLGEACALARVAPPPPRQVDEVDEPPDGRTFGLLAASLLAACPIARQPDVLAYLERRRIASHTPHWGALPSEARELADLRSHLIARHGREAWFASGLARGDGWAWAAHRLIIPWRAPGVDGAVVALQRRAIGEEVEGPRYVFTRNHHPIAPYGSEDAVEEVGDGTETWFVEGAIDAVALRILADRRGAPLVALGLPGVTSWSRHVAAVAGIVEGRVAVVAVDADRAGEAQVHELARALYRVGASNVRRARARGGDWADALELEEAP